MVVLAVIYLTLELAVAVSGINMVQAHLMTKVARAMLVVQRLLTDISVALLLLVG
jgi:RES domain-containing protein